MIAFEIEGKKYAVRGSELLGIGKACPFITYPGLPEFVLGIVEWQGKIFPIFSFLEFLNKCESSSQLQAIACPINLNTCTYLFCEKQMNLNIPLAAFALPTTVKLILANRIEVTTENRQTAIDESGEQAEVLDLRA